jgi:hypothetical protein
VLVDCLEHVAGDYGETVPIETFLDQGKPRSGGQATPDLAILPASACCARRNRKRIQSSPRR